MIECPVCHYARKTVAADPAAHDPWCPLFMRGPEDGGDPYEWPQLFDDRDEDAGARAELEARTVARAIGNRFTHRPEGGTL